MHITNVTFILESDKIKWPYNFDICAYKALASESHKQV